MTGHTKPTKLRLAHGDRYGLIGNVSCFECPGPGFDPRRRLLFKSLSRSISQCFKTLVVPQGGGALHWLASGGDLLSDGYPPGVSVPTRLVLWPTLPRKIYQGKYNKENIIKEKCRKENVI